MNKFVEAYYKTSGVTKIPKRALVLKDEELYQLYKKPTKDKGKAIPTMTDLTPKL